MKNIIFPPFCSSIWNFHLMCTFIFTREQIILIVHEHLNCVDTARNKVHILISIAKVLLVFQNQDFCISTLTSFTFSYDWKKDWGNNLSTIQFRFLPGHGFFGHPLKMLLLITRLDWSWTSSPQVIWGCKCSGLQGCCAFLPAPVSEAACAVTMYL